MVQRSAAREPAERSGNADATARPPLHPLGVLLIAILLPGVGRYAGGFFIFAISLMDDYRWARYRWTLFHRDSGSTDSAAP